MTTHLEIDLDNLKSIIFKMADLAIEAISGSIESLKKADTKLARQVVDKDAELDRLEVLTDNECVKVLVTKQPAAIHLRLVLALIKINTDLERIGDLASNIAKETLRLDGKPVLKPLIDIPRMADITIDMIRNALDSITEKNTEKAESVIEKDNEIDDLNLQIYRELFSYMAENPRTISEALGLIMVVKAIERIGDHATNIAERAIYYISGTDIRHTEE
ncbi:MAG: phosphate signaling complex protein PhoU [Spirochaetes bacterium]|nr:phosphate signaling complex protein PhoU [Spirochaetota bacterium]